MRHGEPESARARSERRSGPLAVARVRARGVTLIEVLITVSLVALMTTMAILGTGVLDSARLKRSSVMIAGAVRVSYGHASAATKTVRLVFDLEGDTVSLEESTGQHLLVKGERSGGAEAATDAEREAQEAGEALLEGPRKPRASFQPAKALGFSVAEGKTTKELERGVRILQVETGHDDEPITEGRAYLYFWPGGQTERAAIQVTRSELEDPKDDDPDTFTIVVAPLTGKTQILPGRAEMPRPREEEDESERDEAP